MSKLDEPDMDAPDLPAAEVSAAKCLELDRFAEYDVREAVPVNETEEGAEWESTRWEVGWQAEKCVVRARFVARQFKWKDPWRDDLFAPASGHGTSRIIDHIALRERLQCFEADAVCAFLNAAEEALVYVAAPRELLQRRDRAGQRTDVVMRSKMKLYGRRDAAQGWTEHLAAVLTSEEFGGLRCPQAPHLFWFKALAV